MTNPFPPLPQLPHAEPQWENLHWVDTHAHLDYSYPFSTEEYVARGRRFGVKTIISIGAEMKNWDQLQSLAHASYEGAEIWYTVGIHPHEASDFAKDPEGVSQRIRQHMKDPRCVAVGEIGMDLYYEHSPWEDQRLACQTQLALALETRKPVVIHSREGEEDLFELLQDHSRLWNQNPETKGRPLGVIHCFSGTEAFAKKCLDLGFYLSFSGIVTFKKAENVRAAVQLAPLDRILTETDAPFLAPVPYRGKQNESALMIEVCKVLAQIKGIDLPALSKVTHDNAVALFGFGQGT